MAFQIYNKNQGIKKVKPGKIDQAKDQIEISDKAIGFQHALKKLKNLDEIRMDKVETIKKQIDAGTYKIDGGKIAEKIMESIDFDQKI